MSVIPPKSSDFLAASSAGFVKPMPRRGQDPRVDQGDSAEFDVGMLPSSPESALSLWRRLVADENDSRQAGNGCAGIQLAHFRIEKQIGRGGMGAVFRAVDTRLDREVALKVLAGTQSSDPSAVSRFQNEARAAARLDHDNVARVFYEGQEQGLHFIAFEFVHGANVRQVIDARGMLSPAETVNYGLQIAHALRHLSSAGVIHRDVKPSNIILTPTGRAKLVDLGLARKHDPEASKDLTVDGTTLGTFDYISPEQAKDPRSVDIRSDIYSLGCTMFHMLTGEPPYPRGTMLQKLLDHQHHDVPDAARLNRSVAPELSAVVRKMMASDPQDRYANADELIGDLSILAHAYGLRPIAPGSPVWSVPGRPSARELVRQNRTWIAAAVLLVVGVFAADAVRSAGSFQADSRVPASSPARIDSQQSTGESAGLGNDGGAGSKAAVDAVQGNVGDQPFVLEGTPMDPITLSGADLPLQGPSGDAVFQFDVLESPFGEQLSPSSPSALISDPLTSESGSETSSDITDEGPPVEPADPLTPSEPFLVTTGDSEVTGYISLAAACNAAPDGGVIELNFDGRLERAQRPVRIVGKRLRLRPGPDRTPVIPFAVPDDWTSAEIVRMISVSRGALEVYGVGFELDVDAAATTNPGFFTGRWILLSLNQADEVILRGVSVTIRNENQFPAAVVEFAEPSLGFDGRMPDAMDRQPLRFDAEDCFIRGEADLFLDENVDPARIRLSNSAVAVEGSLVRLLGMEAIDVVSDMNNEHQFELSLRSLTAQLSKEVVCFDIAPGKSVPRVNVSANNCVFVNGISHPLVSMSGEIDLFDAQQLLEWSGDHTYVETSDPVWKITGFDEQDYGLAEWNDLWKQGRLERSVATSLLWFDGSIPYSEVTFAELELDSQSSLNPAIDGASDRTNAGVHWDSQRLPMLLDSPVD